MNLPRFAMGHFGCMDEEYVFPNTTVSTLLSVIISTDRPFPQPTFTGARGEHKRQLFISPSKFHIRYSKTTIQHYSAIIFTCHPFQPLPISLLRVVVFRSVLFLILQNYKKKKIVLMCYQLAAFHF